MMIETPQNILKDTEKVLYSQSHPQLINNDFSDEVDKDEESEEEDRLEEKEEDSLKEDKLEENEADSLEEDRLETGNDNAPSGAEIYANIVGLKLTPELQAVFDEYEPRMDLKSELQRLMKFIEEHPGVIHSLTPKKLRLCLDTYRSALAMSTAPQ